MDFWMHIGLILMVLDTYHAYLNDFWTHIRLKDQSRNKFLGWY